MLFPPLAFSLDEFALFFFVVVDDEDNGGDSRVPFFPFCDWWLAFFSLVLGDARDKKFLILFLIFLGLPVTTAGDAEEEGDDVGGDDNEETFLWPVAVDGDDGG